MSTLSLRIRDDHLTCTICFNMYDKPKALPCLHSFCEACISDFVISRGYMEMGRFPCPVCREDILIPPEGVRGFRDNHTLISLLETVDRRKYKPEVSPQILSKVSEDTDTVKEGHHYNGGDLSVASAQGSGEPAMPFRQQNPRLYPQLSRQDEHTGPCTKGLVLKFGKFGPAVSDFLKPFGLAVGRNGDFVISDRGGNRIFVYTNDGELKYCFTCNCTVNGVAVTKDNNILVAVSKAGSAIMKLYSTEGRLLGTFGEHYHYDNPSGITVLPTSQVAITNLERDNVYIFTEQFKLSNKFGWKGLGNNHFMQPMFISSTSKNYVVVSDTGSCTIKILDTIGTFKRSFGGKGTHHGQLNHPMGVDVDVEDNIIIADSQNFRVEIFTVKGHFYTTLVSDTNQLGPDVRPINVAVTPKNNVAVLLLGTGFAEIRVYQWKPSNFYAKGLSQV